MKQPKIHIKQNHPNGTDYGLKPIKSLSWNLDGRLTAIEVDFMGNQLDIMPMYDIDCSGTFRNVHNNLIGVIVFE